MKSLKKQENFQVKLEKKNLRVNLGKNKKGNGEKFSLQTSNLKFPMGKNKKTPERGNLCLAGAEGLEPSTVGFGDRCSTIRTTLLQRRVLCRNCRSKVKHYFQFFLIFFISLLQNSLTTSIKIPYLCCFREL